MPTRREFVKQAAALTGGVGFWGKISESIARAAAIAPAPGSSFLDAEHVVILMQENRSFDHCYGTLRGVRGFGDRQAARLPSGDPAWVQTNDRGQSYVPFRLNIKDTNATWMGSLPHSWTDQVDARHDGKYDRWLQAKPSGHKEYADMPLTMGYYNRDDIPFYYQLADAFTVCDQNFCSTLTGTTPNRLHLWTGTIREKQSADSHAKVFNHDVDYGAEAHWKTFPERLEDLGVSWKIYQNEISVGVGFVGEQDAWLANFTDNPIEWFTQYQVRFHPARRAYVARRIGELPAEIAAFKQRLEQPDLGAADKAETAKQLAEKVSELKSARAESEKYTDEAYAKLPARAKALHERAFCTNTGDPAYHELTTLAYDDDGTPRQLQVPKGDVLHQFRADVHAGKLPAVSWLVAPETFSDHPGAAWFGAWYISETLDILTKNPELWTKTVFILTYDENDGYFDHVPPFVPPHPHRPESGKVSPGIDPAVEYVERDQPQSCKSEDKRDSPIGLGYRVPLVIASPWSRGGCVCSEVFDHTSVLRFLEKLLSHKTGKEVRETNITAWRRTVCGDLTSAFAPDEEQDVASPTPLNRDEFIESIHRARFKKLPADFRPLTKDEIGQMRKDQRTCSRMPTQEPGVRRACPLPYELSCDGRFSDDGREFTIQFAAANKRFGERAAGAPFVVYSYRGGNDVRIRNYAVAAGGQLEDVWKLDGVDYNLRAYGPNGFFRSWQSGDKGARIDVRVEVEQLLTDAGAHTGRLLVELVQRDTGPGRMVAVHNAYSGATERIEVNPGEPSFVLIPTDDSFGWYDVEIRIDGDEQFLIRYAGRVETGQWSYSDPALGQAT